ncbi:MAG TPA: class I SAM-dependent methyltransferase [Nitrososphaera sp.]|nr:class I SAM-dependent methyltransferase [uncultured Nitrososphaera sp.]
MDDRLADGIVRLKADFAKNFTGTSPMHEAIPLAPSDLLPIEQNALAALHNFARNNPIYFKWHDSQFLGVPCRVYEGDINEYWLGSIKHDSGYQPFYPTWILSAYALALASKRLGFSQVVDIGSGDGRIAYCAKVAGLGAHGIEIDENLVMLQEQIASATGVEFDARGADATKFDYRSLGLSAPVFFISGLPEMGEMLANSAIARILAVPELKHAAGFAFMGSHSLRKYARDLSKWGWGKVIGDYGLQVEKVVTLPTHWTAEQVHDTPYVFTKKRTAP